MITISIVVIILAVIDIGILYRISDLEKMIFGIYDCIEGKSDDKRTSD